KELYSFFVDLETTNASETEVLNAINIAGIVGANARDDLRVIEFVCKNEAALEMAMTTTFKPEEKQPFVAIMPRHKTNKTVLVKLANVPFSRKDALEEALKTYWTQYGKVLDLAPYQFPGKPWLTKCWDILIQLNDGENKLNAPTVFTLEGYTDSVICSWPRSTKACLRCKVSGHSTSSCPLTKPNIQKVGASANPRRTIGNVGQAKNNAAKATQGVIPAAAKATTSATSATPAIVAPPNPVPNVTFNVTAPLVTPSPTAATSGASSGIFSGSFLTPSVEGKGKGSELQRMYTPPPIGQPDPDTPKKGNKRGAKAETWVPTTDELIAYVTIHRLCRTCLKTGHASRKCTTSEVEIPYAQLASHPRFAEHMQRWIEERRNTKRPARYTQCPRCLDYGHLEEECTAEPVCDHCGYLDCECDNQGEESMDEQAD
ncbi:MAG TPA: hypothetical protein VK667_13020, partial [Ktedonobacteraceae bacterium]|nr:hypothetical protein [Ktedonobacteraceae bacterium]